jgi:hypothetical protein
MEMDKIVNETQRLMKHYGITNGDKAMTPPEPVERLLRFAGKKRAEVSNPNLTAREAIAVANYMVALATHPSIQIDRETLERVLADYDSAAGDDGSLLSWNRAIGNILDLLRAALAAQPTHGIGAKGN